MNHLYCSRCRACTEHRSYLNGYGVAFSKCMECQRAYSKEYYHNVKKYRDLTLTTEESSNKLKREEPKPCSACNLSPCFCY